MKRAGAAIAVRQRSSTESQVVGEPSVEGVAFDRPRDLSPELPIQCRPRHSLGPESPMKM
jgi:hypothetical protein